MKQLRLTLVWWWLSLILWKLSSETEVNCSPFSSLDFYCYQTFFMPYDKSLREYLVITTTTQKSDELDPMLLKTCFHKIGNNHHLFHIHLSCFFKYTSWYLGIPPLTAPLIVPCNLMVKWRKYWSGLAWALRMLFLISWFIVFTFSMAASTGHKWTIWESTTSYQRRIPGSL